MDKKKVIGCTLGGLLVLWAIARIASSTSSASSSQGVDAPSDAGWHLAESRSPMDDSRTVVLSLDSRDLVRGPLGDKRPTLIIRCSQKQTKVYVVTHMAATIEEGLDGGPSAFHKVGLRLDDRPARYESWGESTDHEALFARDMDYMNDNVIYPVGAVVKLAKQLARAKTLTFQFTPSMEVRRLRASISTDSTYS